MSLKQKKLNIQFLGKNICLVQDLVESLNLKSDQLVLDVGCGIGGGDTYMAKV